MDLVRIYTYCPGDDSDEYVSKHLDTMVEDRGNSQDVENLRSNLLEVHSNMMYQVKDKLANFLAALLKIPAPTKYHYCFALFLYPWYVMKLKGIKTFCQSENVDTKTLFQKIIPNFYEYIMSEELSINTNNPQIIVEKIKNPYTSITKITPCTLFRLKQSFWRGLVPSSSYTKIRLLGHK